MLKLTDSTVTATLPSSIKHDEQVLAAAKAIEERLREVNLKTDLLLLLPRLDELSEALVDELAWQYHVDFYDYKADIAKKRALVRNAIAWHRYKGTPAAVEEVCSAVFQTAKVSEWFDYGGKPYHFQVRLIEEPVPDQQVIDSLQRAIAETKNVRSWLDGLSFYREIMGAVYFGAIVAPHKVVSVYPSKFKMPGLKLQEHYGGVSYWSRKVELECQTGMV